MSNGEATCARPLAINPQAGMEKSGLHVLLVLVSIVHQWIAHGSLEHAANTPTIGHEAGMNNHYATTSDATATEIRLPLKMVAGPITTSRTNQDDLNALPMITTGWAPDPLTRIPDTSMTGALVTVVIIQTGRVHNTHDLGQVQASARTGIIVINAHHTKLVTVIETEETSEETLLARIADHAILL